MPKIFDYSRKSSVLSGYGLTGSSQPSGLTGSVVSPGSSGSLPIVKGEEVTILCIEDIGFFKKGEFYDVQLIGNFILSRDGFSHVSIKEIEEKCIWGDKLRDYKLQQILNGTV
jgi:hypothetical protein